MMRTAIILLAVWACASAQAYTVHRSFHRGYPAGSLPGASAPQNQLAPGVRAEGGQPRAQTVTRTKTVRLVRDPGGDFAMKVARGESVHVELKEPADCRWAAPAANASFSAVVERGALAKQRTRGVSTGVGVAVVTVRRLADGDAEVKLVCRKKSAPAHAEPERTLLIRLVKP